MTLQCVATIQVKHVTCCAINYLAMGAKFQARLNSKAIEGYYSRSPRKAPTRVDA